MPTRHDLTRRRFLRQSSAAAGALLLTPSLLGCGDTAAARAGGDAGAPGVAADTLSRKRGRDRPFGVAILGLGGYAKGQIAPALKLTEHCKLTGLITGSPDKLPAWQREHGIADEHCYTYDTMAAIAEDDAVDVVYVITPTATHKDFVLKAAAAGKHVWCEKPMAMTAAECTEMIDACATAGVRLAIGYRMLHEPNTRDLIQLTEDRAYGALKSARSLAGYGGNGPSGDNWRGQRAMGGGALYDMGVYTVNGLRYATQLIPEAVVSAEQVRPGSKGANVDVTTSYRLRFPGGLLADGKTSVVEEMNLLHVEAERGWYEMDPMQPYQGVRGLTSDGRVLGPPVPNQQSIQMDDDALAILNDAPLIAPGEEGRIDVAIIRAIIAAAESGREVAVERF